ncbi:MAG TPA: LysR family transcriptional regulator [Casimicrobium sp.]|nr:LysR family transcriptional regulator [Casimicrobium sp.]
MEHKVPRAAKLIALHVEELGQIAATLPTPFIFLGAGQVNMPLLRNVDLNLLLSLEALLSEENVSRAAMKLNLSQSTVSCHLSKLRVSFGDELMVPLESGRGMVLTPRAVLLGEKLSHVLPLLDALVSNESSFDPTHSVRRFCIATVEPDPSSIRLVPTLISYVRLMAGPGVELHLRSVDRRDALSELESGRSDLLISSAALVPSALRSRSLASESLVFVQRRGHPRGVAPLTLDSYCSLGHVVSRAVAGERTLVDDALLPLNRARNIAIDSQSIGVLVELLATTDYVAVVPLSFALKHAHDIEHFELPFELPPIAVSASWHQRTHHDAGSIWLREMVTHAAVKFNSSARARLIEAGKSIHHQPDGFQFAPLPVASL